MLGKRARLILSWATIVVIAIVVVTAMVILLRGLLGQGLEAPSLAVTPPEVTLCQEQEVAFLVDPAVADVEWAATGGTVSSDGQYAAGELSGDYEVQVAGPGGERGRAIVHVVACTPTPMPTPTPTPPPAPTPTSAPTPIPAVDGEGDVGVYTTGAPAAQSPAGLDIRNASIAPGGQVALAAPEGLPGELAGWAQEGEVVLWLALFDAIPDAPAVGTDWLFALDLDGDIATGRPVGSARINPDLGMEVALGLRYDPGVGSFEPYLLVWDPEIGNWAAGPDVVRTQMNPERTLLALAVPLDVLQQRVQQITGVTGTLDAAVGRAAAVAYTAPETLVDFYPDRPD